MKTDDETKLMDGRQVVYPQYETNNEHGQKKDNRSWKEVAFGATSGILVGAGAMYVASMFGAEDNAKAEETIKSGHPEYVKVAKVSDDLSFTDAFNAARAQVGPGGVFRWHDGLYSTYKEEEWNAMSDESKAEFAQSVSPEVRADEIVVERMSEAHPDVVTTQTTPHDIHEASAQTVADDVQQASLNTTSNGMTLNATDQQPQDTSDSDVHIVGYSTVQGHQAVAVDLTGNGEADVAIIDVDDSGTLTDPDVIVDREGNAATMGQIAQSQEAQEQEYGYGYASDNTDPNVDPSLQQTAYENPELSPDMPDYYINDASVDGTFV